MGTYTPEKFAVPTGLDELGLRLSLRRLQNEDIATYRRRLLLELRDRSGPTQSEFVRSLSRKVGHFDERIARVDVVGSPADPVLMITSSRFLIYDDYANDSLAVDLEIASRDGAYFLIDVANAVNNTVDFAWTWLVDTPADYEYRLASYLMFGHNLRTNELVSLPANYVYEMGPEFVGYPRELWASNYAIFRTRVDINSITNPGDFAFTRGDNGRLVITTEDLMSGNVVFEWAKWPFDIRLAHVRAYPYNDSDIMYRHRDKALDDSTGTLIPAHLNSLGAEIAQAIVDANPMEWGN